jgi:hypothetical protein
MSAVHEVVDRGDAPRHRCVLPDHPADTRHSPYHERFEPRVDAETQTASHAQGPRPAPVFGNVPRDWSVDDLDAGGG